MGQAGMQQRACEHEGCQEKISIVQIARAAMQLVQGFDNQRRHGEQIDPADDAVLVPAQLAQFINDGGQQEGAGADAQPGKKRVLRLGLLQLLDAGEQQHQSREAVLQGRTAHNALELQRMQMNRARCRIVLLGVGGGHEILA